jgi:hypothetical protein
MGYEFTSLTNLINLTFCDRRSIKKHLLKTWYILLTFCDRILIKRLLKLVKTWFILLTFCDRRLTKRLSRTWATTTDEELGDGGGDGDPPEQTFSWTRFQSKSKIIYQAMFIKKISFRIQDNFTRTYFTAYFWTKIKNNLGRTSNYKSHNKW